MTPHDWILLGIVLAALGIVLFLIWYSNAKRCPYCRSRRIELEGKRKVYDRYKCHKCLSTWEEPHTLDY